MLLLLHVASNSVFVVPCYRVTVSCCILQGDSVLLHGVARIPLGVLYHIACIVLA